MRIARTSVTPYGGSTDGARSATATFDTREGLLFRVTYSDGTVGQGEASPLPGYSSDSIEDCRRALWELDPDRLPEPSDDESGPQALAQLDPVIANLPPAARFAVETAVLDALAQHRSVPLFAVLGAPSESVPRIALSALVGGTDDPGSVERARAAAIRGVRTVKLKVVGMPNAAMLDVLRGVRAAAPDAALRLDANGALPLDTALSDLTALAAVDPELIEEPVSAESLPLLGASPVPIALDESLQRPEALSLLAPHLRRLRCVAVVLKPTVLGGFSRCLALAQHAKELGLDVTVSHTFDGPIALAAAAHLALSIATPSRGSGLDRHPGLRAWPPAEIPCIGDDAIHAVDRPGLGVTLLGDGA